MFKDIPENYYQDKFTAGLSDTSCYGSVFYVAYHKWVASTKENFFLKNVEGFSELFKQQGIKLIVLESLLKLHKGVDLHDEVSVFLSCPILKKLKAHLKYIIIDSGGDKIAEAENKIAFVDKNNKLIPIPDNIYKALSKIKEKQ